ncbi:MAG: tetratricopeptide repeat protein [Oligoflexia bacterium]|nr:tetratricopeptide repeat protein [Oligoflexia bacterium]
MQGNSKYDPFLEQYLKIYQENPASRVFAPLAEAYRKSNLIDEAIEICKEGLERHPGFISGMVALARCYYDKQMYKEAITELEKVISEAPDNYLAQKLLAESYYGMNDTVNSLKSYKMVLFLNPRDSEIAKRVDELEYAGKNEAVVTEAAEEIDIPPLPVSNVPPDLYSETGSISENAGSTIENAFQEKPVWQIFGVKDGEDDDEVLMDLSTMTIAELLEEQGHKNKALTVYKKMRDKDPDNTRIKEKINSIEEELGLVITSVLSEAESEPASEETPEEAAADENHEQQASPDRHDDYVTEHLIAEKNNEENQIEFLTDFSNDDWIVPNDELRQKPGLAKLNRLLVKIQKYKQDYSG